MSDGVLAGLTLSTVLLGLWMLRYGGSSPAAWFFFSWVLSTFAVVLYSFPESYPLLASTYYIHGSLASGLVFGGVLTLLGRRLPGWFLPALGLYGVARAVGSAVGRPDWAALLGLPIVLLAATAGVLAIRDRPRVRRGLAFALLGAVLLVVAGVSSASLLTQALLGDAPFELVAVWVVLGPLLLGVELWAVAEHRTHELERSRDQLEKLVEQRAGEIARANASLAASEARYRAVSELSSDFSFCLRIDPERGVVREWVTEAFERITGYPPERLDGDGWVRLLQGDGPEAERAYADRLRGLEDETRFEQRVVRPDGETRRLEVVLRSDHRDGARRILGAARDVTDARRAEQASRELERQVEAARRMESLGMLTGGIAHDFNNLLAVILGNARLLQDELAAGSAGCERLGQIHAAAEQATRLTEQMLAYSGEAILSPTPVELGALVRELGDRLREELSPDCELQLQTGDAVVVEADATRMAQVLGSVVTNAFEALSQGRGRVRVRTGRCALDADALARTTGAAGARPGEYGFIEVSDDGCGMDADTRQRVFEPFFTTKFAGRGLGWAAALGIVRAHGGRVEIESEPGRGTRVRVLLPAAAPGARPPAPPAPGAGDTASVLVVDDDEAVLELAGEFLRRAGFGCHRASGGADAVDLFARKFADIDAVVLDLTMPDLDGRSVFRELRRIRPDVPIVLSTGYSRGALEDEFGSERRVAFLRKPYDPEQLVSAVRRARAGDGA